MTGVDIPINRNSLLSAHWRHHFRKVFLSFGTNASFAHRKHHFLKKMLGTNTYLPIGFTTFSRMEDCVTDGIGRFRLCVNYWHRHHRFPFGL